MIDYSQLEALVAVDEAGTIERASRSADGDANFRHPPAFLFGGMNA